MNLGVWHSNKSLSMQEMRISLKKKAENGKPTPSRREANRTWREDILGILSEDQKKQRKTERQQKNKKEKYSSDESDE
jgi:hypothetical protein